MTIRRVCSLFSKETSLYVNMEKSKILFSTCDIGLHDISTKILRIPKSTLPFCYLGILVTSTKLFFRDCMPLLEKISICLLAWKNKMLSYAGIELINLFVMESLCIGVVLFSSLPLLSQN